MRSHLLLVLLKVLIRIKESLSDTILTDCIHNILEKHSNIQKENILISFDIALKYPVFKIKRASQIKGRVFVETRFDIIIIDERFFNLKMFVAWNTQRIFFNPKAYYIIITDFISAEVFKLFSKHYIAKVYVIDKTFSIFTHDPYKYESAHNPDTTPIKIGVCPNISTEIAFIRTKIPKYWRNTTLKDCFRVLPPYTTEENDGLENLFMKVVQQKLGVKRQSIILPQNSDHTLDRLSVEGTRMLRNLDADVLAGFNSPTEGSPKYFDISGASYSDSIAWISPPAPKMCHWKRISKIFSIKSWTALVVTALLWVYMVHRVHNEVNVFELLFMVLQILLEQSVSKHRIKNRLYFRMMLSAWILAFLVISCLFKNSLLIILGTERRYPELYSTKNILVNILDLKISSYINLSEIYVDSNNHEEYPFNFKKIEYCRSVLRCVNQTAFGRDHITTAPKAIVRYHWIPKYYINRKGEVLVKVSREVIKPFFIHFIFSKGHPLFPQINDILIRMSASGWFNHIYDQMRFKIKRATSPLLFEATQIGINKFYFVFIIWGFGLFVSVVVFCFEQFIYGRNIASFCF